MPDVVDLSSDDDEVTFVSSSPAKPVAGAGAGRGGRAKPVAAPAQQRQPGPPRRAAAPTHDRFPLEVCELIARFVPEVFADRARPNAETVHDWRAQVLQAVRGSLSRLARVSPRFRDAAFPIMREHLRVVHEVPEDGPGAYGYGMGAAFARAHLGAVGGGGGGPLGPAIARMQHMQQMMQVGLSGNRAAMVAALPPVPGFGGAAAAAVAPFAGAGQQLGGGGGIIGGPAGGRPGEPAPEREQVAWLRGVGRSVQNLVRARQQIDSHGDSARCIRSILFVLDPAKTPIEGVALRILLNACHKATDVRIRMIGRYISPVHLPVPTLQAVTHLRLVKYEVSLLVTLLSAAPVLESLELESPVGGDQQVYSLLEALPKRAPFPQLGRLVLDMTGYELSPDLKTFVRFLLGRLCDRVTVLHLFGSAAVIDVILKELPRELVARLIEFELQPVVSKLAYETIDRARAVRRFAAEVPRTVGVRRETTHQLLKDVLATLPADLEALEVVSPELTSDMLVDFILAHDRLRQLSATGPFTANRGNGWNADRDLVRTIARDRRPPIRLVVRTVAHNVMPLTRWQGDLATA